MNKHITDLIVFVAESKLVWYYMMRLLLAVELLQICLATACYSGGEADHRGTTEHLNDDDLRLSYENVVQIASLPLHCYHTEYPNKLR